MSSTAFPGSSDAESPHSQAVQGDCGESTKPSASLWHGRFACLPGVN
ncbi:hypothetical protein OH686_23720 [Pseudomonas sp. SO81]|nr:hypothetical protein OH686_23720 [Pseudomonas sp. SO81]